MVKNGEHSAAGRTFVLAMGDECNVFGKVIMGRYGYKLFSTRESQSRGCRGRPNIHGKIWIPLGPTISFWLLRGKTSCLLNQYMLVAQGADSSPLLLSINFFLGGSWSCGLIMRCHPLRK